MRRVFAALITRSTRLPPHGVRFLATKPQSRRQRPALPRLSLDQFIQRQRVLSLWRTILRSAYKINDQQRRADTVAYARAEFERNRHVTDIGQIRYLVSTGKVEFDSMSRYIDEMAARG